MVVPVPENRVIKDPISTIIDLPEGKYIFNMITRNREGNFTRNRGNQHIISLPISRSSNGRYTKSNHRYRIPERIVTGVWDWRVGRKKTPRKICGVSYVDFIISSLYRLLLPY